MIKSHKEILHITDNKTAIYNTMGNLTKVMEQNKPGIKEYYKIPFKLSSKNR